MRLIEATGLNERNFSNYPPFVAYTANPDSTRTVHGCWSGRRERVNLRQEHFLLLFLNYLLHAPHFSWYGWCKEPRLQVGPIQMPALRPRWRQNLQSFSENLRTVWCLPRTKWKHCLSWDDRRLYTWSISCLHSPSSSCLTVLTLS